MVTLTTECTQDHHEPKPLLLSTWDLRHPKLSRRYSDRIYDRGSEIITTYSHLNIACGCFAKSLIFFLSVFLPCLSFPHSLSAYEPWQCAVQCINWQKLCLSHPHSLSLWDGSSSEVHVSWRVLDRADENEQSRGERGRAEVSQLQGSTLVTNF